MYGKTLYRDRADAGQQLANELADRDLTDALVLAIPAGGVPVGIEIAKHLDLPMDLMIVRKIRIPWNPEAGFGAVTSAGDVILNPRIAPRLGLSDNEIERLADEAHQEVAQREERFRPGEERLNVTGRTVILVDDGLASGYTMLAAVQSVQRHEPRRVIVAVPTASGTAASLLGTRVDDLVALYVHPPDQPFAVASAYRHWHDLSEKEVLEELKRLRGERWQGPEEAG